MVKEKAEKKEIKEIKKKPVKKTVKKKPVKKTLKKKEVQKKVIKKKHYFETVGRRKTAVARVRLYAQEKDITVNGKPLESYFPQKNLQEIIKSPFVATEFLDKFGVTAILKGGGFRAQAEALRHGISRALILVDPELRKKLKRTGYLTRDPRMRERKKFGLKRARRAPQWQKR
ncbi:30S ribosomal protein S9 [Patescibacteria group bacterium]|nr:30S ribosomal protein S9 [Patescibacteria group bacterium]MBU1876858.1 30S ribosomal protein S9 [Patescibacteria group bacterium]